MATAYVATKRAAKRPSVGGARQTQHTEVQKLFSKVDYIFQKHDTNHSGALDRAQLKALMVEINNGEEVTEGEIDDCLKLHAKAKEGEIQWSEAYGLVKIWVQHVEVRPRLEPLMQKYDADKSGRLDKTQLKNLLADLNEGLPVTDSEVEWVLKNADKLGDGQIGRLELDAAISIWYYHIEEEGQGGTNCCCSVQ